jgi:hypothetical protein
MKPKFLNQEVFLALKVFYFTFQKWVFLILDKSYLNCDNAIKRLLSIELFKKNAKSSIKRFL